MMSPRRCLLFRAASIPAFLNAIRAPGIPAKNQPDMKVGCVWRMIGLRCSRVDGIQMTFSDTHAAQLHNGSSYVCGSYSRHDHAEACHNMQI